MQRITRLTILLCLASLAALPGCGGGGAGTGGGPGRVTGRVAAPSGNGRAADAITVSVEGSQAQTQAGADGSFVLNSVPSGLHTLIARSSHRATAVVVEVKSGGETSVGELDLREAGQVSGIVTSAADHSPIADAHVAVMEMVTLNTAETMPHPVRGARTNSDGSYTISGLPVGDYAVTFLKPGFLPATLTLSVASGATTPGDVGLLPAPAQGRGSLSGMVYLVTDSGEKSPLGSALVRLARKGDPEPLLPLPAVAVGQSGTEHHFTTSSHPVPSERELYTFSDSTGAYKIDGVPAGDYIAVAVRPGLEPDQKPVTIAADQAATVDFVLHLRKPRVGIVEGTVSDSATGKPISGASVGSIMHGVPPPAPWVTANRSGTAESGTIFITPDDCVLFTTTDAQGHYQLKVPAGERTIRAFADGFVPGEAQVTVVAGSSVTADIKLTPRDSHEVTLSGHVTRKDGDKSVQVAGATVDATDALETFTNGLHPVRVYQATTNDSGEYALKAPVGSYYVSARKDDFAAESIRVDLSKDTARDFVLVLVVSPPSPPDRKTK